MCNITGCLQSEWNCGSILTDCQPQLLHMPSQTLQLYFCSDSMWVCPQLSRHSPQEEGKCLNLPFFDPSPLHPPLSLTFIDRRGLDEDLGQPPAIKLQRPCRDSGTNGSYFSSDTNKGLHIHRRCQAYLHPNQARVEAEPLFKLVNMLTDQET